MMELKSVGMMNFPTYGKIKHVPNNQPGFICQKFIGKHPPLNPHSF
jgi:hypothetical protein